MLERLVYGMVAATVWTSQLTHGCSMQAAVAILKQSNSVVWIG